MTIVFILSSILQLPKFHGPSLPPKSVLKNTSQTFLEKRRKALDNYLQVCRMVS